MSDKYLRIGTNYYKVVQRPGLNGSLQKVILPWNRQTILDDHQKEYLKDVEKFEGFIVHPSHDNYKSNVHGFYNRYSPLSHNLKISYTEGTVNCTFKFLQHIFGEQIELGLDYLSIIWQRPTQILPILCLVNEERSTGKTTFLNWLKLIFQDNMTINNNEDFKSRFNSDWSEKVIIGGEEIFLNRKEDAERIKNLATAQSTKTESKGKDKIETPFFGKLVFCSNNETNFVYTDDKEIRYWVIKVPVIKNDDFDLLKKLKEEIPFFIALLNQRKIKNSKKSRMWFTKNQIHTNALNKLVKGVKANLEKELLNVIEDHLEDYELDEIKFTTRDLQELLRESFYKVKTSDLREVIIDKWKLEINPSSSYFKYHKTILPGTGEWGIGKTNEKGRYYKFTREFIQTMLNC